MHIFLLHRDLRLTDSTALIHQIKEMDSTTIIFILTPEQVNKKNNDYYNSNSIQFMCESLHELSNDITKKNGKLYFFMGDTLDVLKSIHSVDAIESIAYNLDYSPYAKNRDQQIREWALSKNIICYEKEDYLLYNILDGQTNKADGTYYMVYSAFRNFCLKNLKVNKPDSFNKFKLNKIKKLETSKYYINEKEIDKLYDYNSNLAIRGGRSNALKIIKNLKNWKKYNTERNNFSYKTTMLSSHNHFTTISIRELYWAVLDNLGSGTDIINELHWRDFFTNVIHNNPHMLMNQIKDKIQNKTFKEKYNHIKWQYDKVMFDHWANGTLGIPIIDACMRELNQTGYMGGRGRMVVSSFITKNMLHNWIEAERIFAKYLVDYSCMMNVANWNWQIGGIDPKQYLRIFNPYIQSKKFDSDAAYIKKWVPELNDVPANDIHKWDEKHELYINQGIKYIKPRVDYKKTRDICMKELQRVNKLNN